jgi:CubicO group peptidase (beta-lactamase class C family)
MNQRETEQRHRQLIQDALDHALDEGEIGVQVAAYLGPRLIVDAWTGLADRDTGRPVDGDSLFPVFSVTKAVTATALHLQADRGLVDYDAPVATYWPEFAANGKGAITVRHVLTHRTGAPQMPEGVTPELANDWDWMVEHLAAITPACPAGERSTYASTSFGWLAGEVVRRTDPKQRSFRQFVIDEISGPLRIPDLWLGIDPGVEPRVATLVAEYKFIGEPTPLGRAAAPAGMGGVTFNRPDVHQATLPGGGGIFSARSEARFWAMIAGLGQLDGVRILKENTVRSLLTLRDNSDELDEVLQFVPRIGIGGLRVGGPSPPSEPVVGESRSVLCHPGAGGSIGWADTETGLAVAICHNRMFSTADKDPAKNPFAQLGDAIREIAAELRAEGAFGDATEGKIT